MVWYMAFTYAFIFPLSVFAEDQFDLNTNVVTSSDFATPSSSLPSIFISDVSSTSDVSMVLDLSSTLENLQTGFIPETNTVFSHIVDAPVVDNIVSSTLFYPSVMRSLGKNSAQDFKNFVKGQKDNLENLNIDKSKKEKYLRRLARQAQTLPGVEKTFWQETKDFFSDIFSDEDSVEVPSVKVDSNEIKIPRSPSQFRFASSTSKIKKLDQAKVRPFPSQKIPRVLKDILKVEKVQAAMSDADLPQREDVIFDESEVAVTTEMKELVAELKNNPVKITNYLRENIMYEPYLGAKKGSIGCFIEKKCNDIDSSSLSIALFRAAGIPAHYKQSVAIFSVDQLKNMLLVDETKTVYAALSLNHVPVFTISDRDIGPDIETADFSLETHFALQWVHSEIFYSYDERRGDLDKQWLPVDVVVKQYQKTNHPILHERANFDTQEFWKNYLRHETDLSPVDTYRNDIRAQTGVDPLNSLSYSQIQSKALSFLPLTLPYFVGTGHALSGNIETEIFSSVPDALRYQVRLTLEKENGGERVFSHNFFASDIQNQEISVNYTGVTDEDNAVMEHFGGISLTPSELVDLTPIVQVGQEKIESDGATLLLGESLLMRFELVLDEDILYTDEKYSLVGNNEGIYITLSQIQDSNFSNPSQILTQGNSAIAWKYLKTLQEKGKFLSESLDYAYNVHFARAVVTQNRIVSEFEGTPTTFDFAGLTIDTSIYVMDYSRCGDYKNHQKDFRLLFGLEESFLEGKIFEDLSGLSGISTVTGLQYASTHNDYFVETITLENENVIDTLDFSLNTREHMHRAVQSGATVITPDRLVQQGSFRGVLYIVLHVDGTATYAIGEQALQNGAWTFDTLEITTWNEGNRVPDFAYQIVKNGNWFIYKENGNKNIYCNIGVADFDRIVQGQDAPGWSIERYGLPCLLDTKNGPYRFGNHDHNFILATNGVYFQSDSDQYNYWKSLPEVVSDLRAKFPDENIHMSNVYPYWGTLTYAKGNPNWDKQEKITQLSVFSPKSREVYEIKNEMAKKYISGKKIVEQYVPAFLGFPLGEQDVALQSIAETNGFYQNFTGGQMYSYDGDAFVVAGFVHSFFNDANACRSIEIHEGDMYRSCGSGGLYGFPKKDLALKNGRFEQEFEEGILSYDSGINNVSISRQSKESRRFENKQYAQKYQEKAANGEITDVEAFAHIADYIASRTQDSEEFVTDLSVVFTGAETMIKYWMFMRVYEAKSVLGVYDFSDTGFKFSYNDSHYCVEAGHNCISNQILHSMLGFNHAYFYGKFEADHLTHEHDPNPSPLAYETQSLEDIWLGEKMSILGEKLRNGEIQKGQVGIWIMNNLAVSDVQSARISRSKVVELSSPKSQFRVFEYQNGGNVYNKWLYDVDMRELECPDHSKIYIQDYIRFTYKNQDVGSTRMVFDATNEKMIPLVGVNYTKYKQNENLLCLNFYSLSQTLGEPLTTNMYEFMQKIKDSQ